MATIVHAWQVELARGSIDIGWSGNAPHRWGSGALRTVRMGIAGAVLPRAARLLGRTLDLLCPSGRSALLAEFAGTELWTCVVVGRGDRGIHTVLGPEMFRDRLGTLSGDLRADHRAICRVVRPVVGKLFVACSARPGALSSLFRRSTGDPWSRAHRRNGLVIDPGPAALTVPLLVDDTIGRLVSVAMPWSSAR
jgi:hypothetical protein